MLSNVFHRITVSEVSFAVAMYIIVRSIIWLLKQIEHVGETELQHIIHRHVHERHKGSYRHCEDCVLASTDVTDLAL